MDYSQDYLMHAMNGVYQLPTIVANEKEYKLEEAKSLAANKKIPVALETARFTQIVIPHFKYYTIDKGKDPDLEYDTISIKAPNQDSPDIHLEHARKINKPVVVTNKLGNTRSIYTPEGDILEIGKAQ